MKKNTLTSHLVERQGCPWMGTRNKFQAEFAFFGTGTVWNYFLIYRNSRLIGVPKSQINFVHERFFAVNSPVFK